MAELSIILPAYNERDNVVPMIEKVRAALKGVDWEIIYVDDDSPDETASVVRQEALKDPRIRLIQRIGRRGLSSACIEGMLSSSAPYMAVMDADMQHDERILPQMLSVLKIEKLDIVVGSRYVKGGGTENWSEERQAASRHATRFAQALTGVKLEDPMSGFFLVSQAFFHRTVRHLNSKGFKILLDLMMSSPEPVKFKEIPFVFRRREHGVSKLSLKVVIDYFVLVADKAFKRNPWLAVVLALGLGFAALLAASLVPHFSSSLR